MFYNTFAYKDGNMLQIDELISEHEPKPVPPGPVPLVLFLLDLCHQAPHLRAPLPQIRRNLPYRKSM